MTTATRSGLPGAHLPWWAWRAGSLFLVVGIGYWLSLATLWRDLGSQTPLAFVGLAPLLALGLLVAGLARRTPLPTPGRVDLIVGGALLALAGAIVLLGPTAASLYFWSARLDIASLPVYAAGALILLFGWRVLFVARGAIILLFLAWPLPYLVLLEHSTVLLTDLTVAGLSAVTALVPMASEVRSGEALFTVNHATEPFRVQIASACAGLNSTVAFLLVGSAFVILLKGRLLPKVAWFAVGLVLVFLLNVVRVVLLVAVGASFGETAALEFFHPIAGMVALVVALLVMLAVLDRFGLKLPSLKPEAPLATPLPEPARPPFAKRAVAGRLAVLTSAALLFGSVNATFAAYEQGPLESGTVVIDASVTEPSALLGGWAVVGTKEITIGRPYYGVDSTWLRHRATPPANVPKRDRYTAWIDVITVTDRQRLVDYGVEKCYAFHGASIDAAEPVPLGGGVVGRIIATTNTAGSTWVTLWWEWPIQSGGEVRHQRVAILVSTTARPSTQPVDTSGSVLVFEFGTAAIPEELRPLAKDVAALATRVVAEQTTVAALAR